MKNMYISTATKDMNKEQIREFRVLLALDKMVLANKNMNKCIWRERRATSRHHVCIGKLKAYYTLSGKAVVIACEGSMNGLDEHDILEYK